MNTEEAFEYWALDDDERALVAVEVTEQAPEVFAICELDRDDTGEPWQGSVVAWGLALPNRTEVVSTDGGMRGRFDSVDGAMRLFCVWSDVGIARPRGEG
jgi:hypothetical protein